VFKQESSATDISWSPEYLTIMGSLPSSKSLKYDLFDYIIIEDKKMYTYKWSDIKSISEKIYNKKVTYVSDVVEASGEDVLSLLSSITGEEIDIPEDDGYRYLHYTQKGRFVVPYEGKSYIFKGITDAKLIEDLPNGFIEKCKAIADGLKSGIFKIIDSNELAIIKTENEKIKKKSSILVDSSISAKDLVYGDRKHDDVIQIELGE
jgi:hypothetical protein